MRVCTWNTCRGYCHQKPTARPLSCNPEYVKKFMHFIAEDLRELMAKLGELHRGRTGGTHRPVYQKMECGIDLTPIINTVTR